MLTFQKLETFKHPFPENCIIFHLTDGCYTSFTDLPPSAPIFLQKRQLKSPKSTDLKDTSSYDQLMKLKNLEECIYDAETTRSRVENQTISLLQTHKDALAAIKEADALQQRLKDLKKAVTQERRRYETAERQKDNLNKSISTRQKTIITGEAAQIAATAHVESAKPQLEQSKQALEAVVSATTYQRRRILEELQQVYPIEHVCFILVIILSFEVAKE